MFTCSTALAVQTRGVSRLTMAITVSPAAAMLATSCQRRRTTASISRSWESRARDGRGSAAADG